MTVKLLDNVDFVDQDRTIAWEDNFLWYISPHFWTATLTDSGTITALTTHGGGVVIAASDGSVADNDQSYLGGTNKNLVPTNQKPLVFQATIQYTEANTDDANVIVGLSSTTAAELLVDDGAGIAASFSGIGFFKVDGGTNWKIFASIGTTQTIVELTAANSLDKIAHTAGGSAKQTLRVEFIPYSSTKAELLFYIDGVCVYSLDWTYTSVVGMAPVIGVKNGGSNAETVNVYNTKLKTLR